MEPKNKKNMTFFVKVLIFLVLFKFVDVYVGEALYYYKYYNKPNMHELMWRDFYSHEENTIDVMFLGSSHARFAFDSEYFNKELGADTFNLSSSGQTPVVGYFALKEALKYQKPKVLVYEAYWRLFGTSDDVTPAFFVYDYIEGIDTKAEMLPELIDEKDFSSFFVQSISKMYKYRDGIKPALINILKGNILNKAAVVNNVAYEDYTYYTDGYFGSDKVATTNKLYVTNPFKKAGNNFSWNNKQLEYMEKTVELCRENNIPVLVVTAPMPKPTMEFLKDYSKSNAVMEEFTDELKVEYIDFNTVNIKEKLFTNDMFYDSNHLNVKGTKTLDKILVPVIKKYL